VTVCGNGIAVLGSAGGDCSAPATSGTPLPPLSGQPGGFPEAGFPGVVGSPAGLPLPRDGAGSTAGVSATADGQLAYTGSSVTALLLAGLLALALGVVLSVASRRRAS
jgi:LPXTG-motif cell wall-anchored protein